jgi:predicted porin
MKKSLFAIAAVTAFAGAAQAQSSVTVYGLLDYGYQGSNQTQAGPASSTVSATTNVVTKTAASGIAGSGQSTSRLGVRGNEDLGGGLSAFFVAEVALNTDNSSTAASATAQGTTAGTGQGLFGTSGSSNRQTLIGLGKKGLGRASIGLQQTPFHNAVAATSAGGTNNQIGDVIYDRAGQTAGTSYTASGMGTNTGYTVRTTNALILSSENISGFQVNAMLVTRGSDTTQTAAAAGGESSNTGMGVGINYTLKNLFVTANYQEFNQEQTAGINGAAPVFAPGYNGAVTTIGNNAKDTQQYYAATYDFGIMKVFAGYINRKVVNNDNNANYITRTAQQIGVTAPITKTINVFASGGTGRVNNTGTNGPTANFTGWQLGSNYVLSKRTNLYAIYGASNTANATTGAYAASATSTANTSWNQSSYAIGMRHTF